MQAVSYRSWVEVSRRQIADNLRAVKHLVGPQVAVMPVVKADAYRHGAIEVSRVLVAEGVDGLAVSSVEEGVSLREAGINAQTILVMADFLSSERRELIDYKLTPVIHSLDDIAAWDRLAAGGRPLGYHLKVDSGMGRLGVFDSTERIIDAILRHQNARLEGLMTHFASSADYSSGQTSAQTATFQALVEGLGGRRNPTPLRSYVQHDSRGL